MPINVVSIHRPDRQGSALTPPDLWNITDHSALQFKLLAHGDDAVVMTTPPGHLDVDILAAATPDDTMPSTTVQKPVGAAGAIVSPRQRAQLLLTPRSGATKANQEAEISATNHEMGLVVGVKNLYIFWSPRKEENELEQQDKEKVDAAVPEQQEAADSKNDTEASEKSGHERLSDVSAKQGPAVSSPTLLLCVPHTRVVDAQIIKSAASPFLQVAFKVGGTMEDEATELIAFRHISPESLNTMSKLFGILSFIAKENEAWTNKHRIDNSPQQGSASASLDLSLSLSPPRHPALSPLRAPAPALIFSADDLCDARDGIAPSPRRGAAQHTASGTFVENEQQEDEYETDEDNDQGGGDGPLIREDTVDVLMMDREKPKTHRRKKKDHTAIGGKLWVVPGSSLIVAEEAASRTLLVAQGMLAYGIHEENRCPTEERTTGGEQKPTASSDEKKDPESKQDDKAVDDDQKDPRHDDSLFPFISPIAAYHMALRSTEPLVVHEHPESRESVCQAEAAAFQSLQRNFKEQATQIKRQELLERTNYQFAYEQRLAAARLETALQTILLEERVARVEFAAEWAEFYNQHMWPLKQRLEKTLLLAREESSHRFALILAEREERLQTIVAPGSYISAAVSAAQNAQIGGPPSPFVTFSPTTRTSSGRFSAKKNNNRSVSVLSGDSSLMSYSRNKSGADRSVSTLSRHGGLEGHADPSDNTLLNELNDLLSPPTKKSSSIQPATTTTSVAPSGVSKSALGVITSTSTVRSSSSGVYLDARPATAAERAASRAALAQQRNVPMPYTSLRGNRSHSPSAIL